MQTVPSRYGSSPGGYKSISEEPIDIPMTEGGINTAKGPMEIEDGESPDASNVLFLRAGVAPAYGQTLLGDRYAGAADKTVIGISEFQRKNLSTVLVRHRPTEWDRWNGVNWLTLGGAALTGIPTDRLYTVVMSDMLVAANKVDKLKAWLGGDADPVADLSADAPIAYYIAPIGNRLVAARIKVGGSFDPYKVQWSADGDITEWTDPLAGAGNTILEPEGKTGSSEFIMGMSALETAIVLYRNRSIMLGTRTGVGAQPFRWNTTVFGLGTDSPYSIANGGAQIGDFFLGNDLNVYLFNGKQAPINIGEPIEGWLKGLSIDPTTAFGQVDKRRQEYWLVVDTGSSWVAWIFNISLYLLTGKIRWRRRDLGTGWTTLGFGATQSTIDPVVDAVLDIVDTVGHRVDEIGSFGQEQRILLGDDNGGVSYQDKSVVLTDGYYVTKQGGFPEQEETIDKVFLVYTGRSTATVEVSMSTDGNNWINPQQVELPIGTFAQAMGAWFLITCALYQFRVRILSGDCTIHKLRFTRQPRARTTA